MAFFIDNTGARVEAPITPDVYRLAHAANLSVPQYINRQYNDADPKVGSAFDQACAALVKPGGHVFFSTINRNAKAFVFAIVGAEYVLNLLPRGTHEFAKFIKPSELAASARRAGLELLQTRGMEYNPLTQHYWLSANTSVNYMLATSKPA